MATTGRASRLRGGFGAGVGAAIAMMIVMGIIRFVSNTISIPELMEESIIRLTGGQIESYLINTLGVGGKALLLVTIMEGTLLLGGILGYLYVRFWPGVRSAIDQRWSSALMFGLIIGTLLNAVFLPLVDQGFFGATAIDVTAPPDIAMMLYDSPLAPFGIPVWVNMYLLSLVFSFALVILLHRPQPVPAARSEEMLVGRRSAFRALGGVLLALLGGGVAWLAIRSALTPPAVPELVTIDPNVTAAQPGSTPEPATTEVPGLSSTPPSGTPLPPAFANVKPKFVPEITPVENFYITTKNFLDPTVDASSWKLSFKGLVDTPYSISYAELKAMPALERIETLACISNPVGGDLISNARWRGVNFADLLKKAGPKPGAVDLLFRAADGYTDSIPLDVALNNECFLAYEMNDQPLVPKHGYPARLLVPGIYGMKNVKWLNEIELVNYDYKGYWEGQGWSDEATYQTMARIDYPNQTNIQAAPLYISGVAFAGNRGIKSVEVSTDGGKNWNEAILRQPLGKYTWVLWYYPWQPAKGTYALFARAIDGRGQVQPGHEMDTFPDGATGYQKVIVIAA